MRTYVVQRIQRIKHIHHIQLINTCNTNSAIDANRRVVGTLNLPRVFVKWCCSPWYCNSSTRGTTTQPQPQQQQQQ